MFSRNEKSEGINKYKGNPFIRDYHIWDRECPIWDRCKTAVLTVLLLPIRVLIIIILLLVAWTVANIGLYGYSRDDIKLKPLLGWRRKLRTITGFLFRSMYFFGSASYVKVKGKLASKEEAPILIGAPHSSFFDALAVLLSGPASVVGKIEAGEIPFYGKLIDFAQPIYVCREDHNSRSKTIQDILDRVNSKHDWPQIMIFPEGTCTNKKCLIQFKNGAFNPGQPIQPILIRYPNKIDTLTWTWQGPNVFILLWRTLAQFHNYVEIEYLPVYNPSEEEIKNPSIFAQNVQLLMSKALNLPISEYAFDDCKLMEYAARCGLSYAAEIAEMAKLREVIGLSSSQIEEYIVKENFKGSEEYIFNFEAFVQRLKIPANENSRQLFKLFLEPQDAHVINFKEYLLHALLLIKIQEPKIELLKLLFMLYSDSGKLERKEFNMILKKFVKISSKKINDIFNKYCEEGSITFDNFYQATVHDGKFKVLYQPNRNFRQKKM